MRFKKVEQTSPVAGNFHLRGRYELNTKHGLGIYIRQSTLKQKNKRRQSRELQTKDFLVRGLEWGWSREEVYLFDDTGQTAVVELAEREQLMLLIDAIKAGKIKTVMIYMVDRMFRSQYLEDAVQFAQVCVLNHVILITYYGQSFDFTDGRDYENFIIEAHKAYGAYKSQIIDRMGDMRKRATQAGEYNGRFLGLGYMRDPDNLTNIKPYAEHSERIVSIFEAYRDNGFSLYRTAQKVCSDHVFPPVLAELRPFFKYKAKPGSDGWYGLSLGGLRSILTNPLYIGWWYTETHDTEGHPVYLKEHHTLIVPEPLFWTCFENASSVTVDGQHKERSRRYVQACYQDSTPALLKKLITGEEPGEYVNLDRTEPWRYRIMRVAKNAKQENLGQISYATVEDAVVRTMLDLMKQENCYQNYTGHMKQVASQEEQDRV